MKDILRSKCATCSLNGYSPEICRFHLQRQKKRRVGKRTVKSKWRNWSNRAALGAGLGVAGAMAGMAVAPLFGAKALLGHAIAAKIAGSAGAVGAGSGLVVEAKKKEIVKRSGDCQGRRPAALLPRFIGSGCSRDNRICQPDTGDELS